MFNTAFLSDIQIQLFFVCFIFILPAGFSGFPRGSVVKNPPANAGDAGSIPGSGRAPTEGNGNPLSILAWEIPSTEESGGLQSVGSQKSWT